MLINADNSRITGPKVAWVFGGTSDIGQSIIEALNTAGYIINFTWNSCIRTAKEITNKHPNATAYRLDLSCDKQVNDFCNSEIQALRSHLVVYCAGVNNATFCDQLDPDALEAVTRINFTSAAKIFNAAGGAVKPHKTMDAKFVYISSVAAKKITVGNTLYGATKAAMERYLAGLAAELARFNIRTLCISPGYVHTRMLEKYCSSKGVSMRDLQKQIPTRQFLSVNDVSGVTLAFASGLIVTTGTVITLGNGERLM